MIFTDTPQKKILNSNQNTREVNRLRMYGDICKAIEIRIMTKCHNFEITFLKTFLIAAKLLRERERERDLFICIKPFQ